MIYIFPIVRRSKVVVLVIFTIWTSFSILTIPLIEVGLDQELSMAKDSYIVKYFRVSTIYAFHATMDH